MAMSVMHNSGAAMALGELNKNVNKVGKLLGKVSSGMKINSAQDDAAGYAISEKMREQIRSLLQDNQNVQNGASLLRTAEGGIDEIVNELRRLKELAINSANDSNSNLDRQTIQKEFNQRMANINDIATETNYNGQPLLDGTWSRISKIEESEAVEIPVSADIVFLVDTTGSMGGHITAVAKNLRRFTDKLTDLGVDWRIGLVRYDDITTKTSDEPGPGKDIGIKKILFDGKEFTTDADKLVDELNYLVKTLGYGGDADESGYDAIMDPDEGALSLEFRSGVLRRIVAISDANNKKDTYSTDDVISALKEKGVSLSAVTSSYARDWKILEEATDGLEYNINGNYGEALASYADTMSGEGERIEYKLNPLIIHHGTKANQQIKLYINDMHTKTLKGTIPNEADIERLKNLKGEAQEEYENLLSEARVLTLDDVNVKTKHGANVAIRVIDGAIDYALDESTRMGSYIQRLEYTDSNITTTGENTQGAESTIRDADMAREMTEYTKYNILTQSSQAMLAQANQNGAQVLSLLQ